MTGNDSSVDKSKKVIEILTTVAALAALFLTGLNFYFDITRSSKSQKVDICYKIDKAKSYIIGPNLSIGTELQYAKTLEEFDRLSEAILILDKDVLERDPNNQEALLYKSMYYIKMAKLDDAFKVLNGLITDHPKFHEAYNTRGHLFYRKGDCNSAIKDWSTSINLNEKYSMAYYNRGYCYYEMKDYEKAINDYTLAIKHSPRYAKAYYNRGKIRHDQRDYENAIKDLETAIDIFPEFLQALNRLAWILSTCQDTKHRNGKRAVELSLNAVELNDNYRYLDTLSASYAEAGDFKKSIAITEKIISEADITDIESVHLEVINATSYFN